ncbi:MAG: hypothetical protein J0I01_13620 [Stenotrophomonas nitritireducens]|uniref:hypothetical protein n=1 Tax=Stenotrophomonas nitritireducens TaxID=83617 RepID=UPI001ACA3DD9|nr:hypothetical protein [Stenotrophomonas nitritireducens]MBN8793259.1 hypothetical protein [Stenotrophomonas nitritireducens]MBN8797290.1 hypothetical protein [Stenotrophomonas nitritireducens]
MKSQICYASLAVYAKYDRAAELLDFMGGAPTLTGERGGGFSYIYSTRGVFDSVSPEEHVEYIKDKFYGSTEFLSRLFGEGCEMRVWVFFEVSEENRAVVLDQGFIEWMSSFGADLCIDVWRS